ncbi:MAG: preprotein translocase YidC, partial [Candidatus Cloacimonetes bacterium]|nr:preprotein translocase YidC [Candidatus Cloacimonadota bacterium]
MDKRTLTALLLMFLLWMVFNQFVWKPQQAQQQALPATTPAETKAAVVAAPESLSTLPAADSLLATSAQAQIVKLSNSNMTVSFNTKGASIAGIELNKFSMKNGTRV